MFAHATTRRLLRFCSYGIDFVRQVLQQLREERSRLTVKVTPPQSPVSDSGRHLLLVVIGRAA